MVQKKMMVTVDDIDGTVGARPVPFPMLEEGALRWRVIDLAGDKAVTVEVKAGEFRKAIAELDAKYRDEMAKYIEHARRYKPTEDAEAFLGSGRNGAHEQGDYKNVREWAAANGYDVAPTGRVKQEIMDAYTKQLPGAQAPATPAAKKRAKPQEPAVTVEYADDAHKPSPAQQRDVVHQVKLWATEGGVHPDDLHGLSWKRLQGPLIDAYDRGDLADFKKALKIALGRSLAPQFKG